MKPRPLESFWKSLPGLKRALSLKLGKFVKIGSKKISAFASKLADGRHFSDPILKNFPSFKLNALLRPGRVF